MTGKNSIVPILVLIVGISLIIIGINEPNSTGDISHKKIGGTEKIENIENMPSFIHPNMYLNINEIENIRNNIRSDSIQQKIVYDRFMIGANNSLNVTVKSVTFGGKIPPSEDIHDYWTDAPYSSDGIVNLSSDRADNTHATELGRSVRNLGLAYVLTGDTIYADKAVRLINGWTVDPSTKMNPKFTNGQSQIDLSVSMPSMFYGADLIWNYPGWNQSDKNAFKVWTQEIISSAKTWSRNNNFENWRLVFISSASVITEDTDSLNYTFDRWKYIMSDQVNPDGSMKYELTRTNSLTYSTFAINAMVQTAEIARHYDIDLYNYKLSDGRGLELIFDFHVPYIMGEKTWPFRQITAYNGDNTAIYELAYSFRQKSSYRSVIYKWGRPMYEMRVLGPVTLTHVDNHDI